MSEAATTPSDIQETPQEVLETIEFPIPADIPTEPEKHRGGPQPLEIKARIHAALERHSGNREAAAAELGMTVQDIKNRIYECPDLRLRWTIMEDGVQPDEIESMTRGLKEPISVSQERLAELVRKESESGNLQRSLESIGMSPRKAALGVAFSEFSRNHFVKQLQIVSGALTGTSMNTHEFIDETLERLRFVRNRIMAMGDAQNETRVAWVEEEYRLSEIFLASGDLMRKTAQTNFDGHKTLALAQMRKNSMKRVGTPGFQDIDSNVS